MYKFHSPEYNKKIAAIINANEDARYAATAIHNDAIDYVKELKRFINGDYEDLDQLMRCMVNVRIGLDVLDAGLEIDPEKAIEYMNHELGESE